MNITKRQSEIILEMSKPLIEFINNECHPHVKIEIDSNSVTVLELCQKSITNEFIKD
jgi:hypothetical protein